MKLKIDTEHRDNKKNILGKYEFPFISSCKLSYGKVWTAGKMLNHLTWHYKYISVFYSLLSTNACSQLFSFPLLTLQTSVQNNSGREAKWCKALYIKTQYNIQYNVVARATHSSNRGRQLRWCKTSSADSSVVCNIFHAWTVHY